MTRGSRPVLVLVHPSDGAVADVLTRSLHTQGLDVLASPPDPAPQGLVIIAVMSATALGDSAWCSTVERFRGYRVVPVAADPSASYDMAPDFLREINWIPWDPVAPEASAALAFRAAVTDIVEYQGQRSLETQALTWVAQEGDTDQLIGDVRQARAAVRLSASGAAGLRPENAELVRAFAGESLRFAKKQRRKRRWRLSRAVLAAALLVGIPAYALFGKIRQVEADTTLVLGALDGGPARPDLNAVKWAGISDLGTGSQTDLANRLVLDTMYRSWGTGAIAWDGNYVINDVSFTDDAHRSFTVDGQGAVAVWDVPRAKVLDRVQIAQGTLYSAAISRDGRWLAASGPDDVYLIDTTTWASQRWRHTGEPSSLVVSAEGASVSWVTPSGQVATGERGRPDLVVSKADAGRGVTVAAHGADGTEALVRVGNELRMIDPVSSRILARTTFPAARFETAAVSEGGSRVAITGADGQLWVGDARLSLHPTGQGVPDVVTALAVTDRGWVLFASDQFGAQVLAPDEGLLLGAVCPAAGTTSHFRIRGEFGVCIPNMRTFDLHDLSLSPPPTGADLAGVNATSIAHGHGGALSGAALDPKSGGIAWAIAANLTDYPSPSLYDLPAQKSLPEGTRATSLVISPAGQSLAVGTSNGWVIEYDVHRGADRNSWSLIENGRSHLADGSAVTALGYATEPGHLLARTAGGHWFTLFACPDCSRGAPMVDRIAARRWNMYPNSLLTLLSEETRARLHLQPLPVEPPARTP